MLYLLTFFEESLLLETLSYEVGLTRSSPDVALKQILERHEVELAPSVIEQLLNSYQAILRD